MCCSCLRRGKPAGTLIPNCQAAGFKVLRSFDGMGKSLVRACSCGRRKHMPIRMRSRDAGLTVTSEDAGGREHCESDCLRASTRRRCTAATGVHVDYLSRELA